MKQFLSFLFCLYFTAPALADSYQIVSMLEKDALVTHRLLSFKVKDSGGKALDVESVNVNIGCDAMIDVHYKDIFHIMCTEETKVQGSIYLSNGELVSLQTFTVRQLGKVFSFPADQPTGPSTEPSLALGRNLFKNNCLSCHATQAISKPQTEASVASALARDPMKSSGLDTKFVGDKQKLGSLVLYINEEF